MLCFTFTEKRILISGPTKHLLVIEVFQEIDIGEYEPLQYAHMVTSRRYYYLSLGRRIMYNPNIGKLCICKI